MSSGPRGCRVFVMCQLYKQTTQTDHWKGAHTCHQTTTDSRMSNTFKVFCLLIDHKGTPLGELFSVSCLTSETVSDLKKKVKEEKPNDLGGVDADHLTVWRCMDELDETDPTALASRVKDAFDGNKCSRLGPRRILDSAETSVTYVVEKPLEVLENKRLTAEHDKRLTEQQEENKRLTAEMTKMLEEVKDKVTEMKQFEKPSSRENMGKYKCRIPTHI